MRVSVLMLLVMAGCAAARPEGIVLAGELGFPLGTYLTVEGRAAADRGKVNPARTLVVDAVNGRKLAPPVSLILEDPEAKLPPDGRVVLRGYETGKMIGTPPAEIEAAEEAGREIPVSQAGWQFYRTFVVISWVEPRR